jgi:hypothetical protein
MVGFQKTTTLLSAGLFLLLGLTPLSSASAASAITDAATGISFPGSLQNGLQAFGAGVRKKGPIKVYGVAMYAAAGLKEKLSALSQSKDKVKAFGVAQKASDEGDVTFLLEMNFKVGAEKMVSYVVLCSSNKDLRDQSHQPNHTTVPFYGELRV